MKHIIFYYTGSGNSLALAKYMQLKNPESELISIPKAFANIEPITADVVGFVFPVYAWGMPRMLEDFLSQVKFDTKPYIYALVTRGGYSGKVLPQMNDYLKKKGQELSLGFGIKMPANFIIGYNPRGTEDVQEQMEKIKVRADKINELIKIKHKGLIDSSFFLFDAISFSVHRLALNHFKKGDKNFWINENCIDCHICEKICPRNNIQIVKEIRTWKHDCEMCLACIHWCPKQAIQYKNITAKRRRYTHPEIKVEELFLR